MAGAVILVAVIVGVVLALNGTRDDSGDNPTEETTQAPAIEEETDEPEPVATEEPMAEATPEVTDEPEPVVTEEPTEEPTEAPEPIATEELTEEPPPDPCAEHGGVQWMGDTCVCEGVIVEVTICNDGVQTDNVTDSVCVPGGDTCGSGSGGDGGGENGGECPPWGCDDEQ